MIRLAKLKSFIFQTIKRQSKAFIVEVIEQFKFSTTNRILTELKVEIFKTVIQHNLGYKTLVKHSQTILCLL